MFLNETDKAFRDAVIHFQCETPLISTKYRYWDVTYPQEHKGCLNINAHRYPHTVVMQNESTQPHYMKDGDGLTGKEYTQQ